jgi:ribosomal protein L44E
VSEITKEHIQAFLKEASSHKPYEEYREHWRTESEYWAWLRGELRRLWQHWKPRNKLKMDRRVKVTVLDSRGVPKKYKTGKRVGELVTRYEIQCEICNEFHMQSNIEADHVEPSGACTNAVEAATFLYRLLVSSDKLRLVCKECHKIHTYAERYGISFEESAKKKRIIELTKIPVDKQREILLSFGFKSLDIVNKSKREACYKQLIEEGKL